MKPYVEIVNGDSKIRILTENVDSHELVWHRDKNDRTVTILQSQGWKFQLDNELPKEMKSGDILEIKKNIYHRVIKGDGDLIIKIKEH